MKYLFNDVLLFRNLFDADVDNVFAPISFVVWICLYVCKDGMSYGHIFIDFFI
jgi:hypothetical protein